MKTHFRAKAVKETVDLLSMKLIYGRAYRPEGQGSIERMNGNLFV